MIHSELETSLTDRKEHNCDHNLFNIFVSFLYYSLKAEPATTPTTTATTTTSKRTKMFFCFSSAFFYTVLNAATNEVVYCSRIRNLNVDVSYQSQLL